MADHKVVSYLFALRNFCMHLKEFELKPIFLKAIIPCAILIILLTCGDLGRLIKIL